MKKWLVLFLSVNTILIYADDGWKVNENKITCEEFINEIAQNDFTIDRLIEKYGIPDKKDEPYDRYGGDFVTIYYGNNEFHFYVNDKENINTICDWKIRDNLNKYFPDNKVINKNTIINTFHNNNNNYDEMFDSYFNEYYIRYLLDISVLIFILKDDKLNSIEWSLDR